MNQTRTFLMFALLAVAYFLFLAWEKDYAPPPPTTAASGGARSFPRWASCPAARSSGSSPVTASETSGAKALSPLDGRYRAPAR